MNIEEFREFMTTTLNDGFYPYRKRFSERYPNQWAVDMTIHYWIEEFLEYLLDKVNGEDEV